METISSVRMINYRFLDDSSFLGFFLFILQIFFLFILAYFMLEAFLKCPVHLVFHSYLRMGYYRFNNCFSVW